MIDTRGLHLAGLTAGFRAVVDAHVAEGELDGFIAAHFLSRFGSEDLHARLADALRVLQEDFQVTRQNVARLGIAVERGWVAPTASMLDAFASGYEQLERQRPEQAVDFRASLKLLYGVALAAAAAPVRGVRPDLAARVARHVHNFREKTSRIRDLVLATAVLAELEPSGRDELARDLAHRLLAADERQLDQGDALAVAWAFRRNCFGSPVATATSSAELRALGERLLPRALRGGVADVFDALLGDAVLGAVARDLATGFVLPRDALEVVLRTFDAFPELARRLRERKHGRPAVRVENEYDVQDLVYVALKAHLPDLTDEEWTPKHAGGAKRIDVVSVTARVCIEAKMPPDAKHAREVADELRIDIESYHVHPACDTLALLVYDPNAYIADARRVEEELSGPRDIKGRRVEVIVRIRPR